MKIQIADTYHGTEPPASNQAPNSIAITAAAPVLHQQYSVEQGDLDFRFRFSECGAGFDRFPR